MTFSRSASVLALLTLAACGAQKPVEAPERVEGVATMVAQVAAVPDVYETTGTVRAQTTSQLAAKVMGNVTRVLVREGDSVKRGQLLLTLDPREADAQLQKAHAGSQEIEDAIAAASAAVEAATANASLAETTYKRFLVLRDRGSVSAQEFDQVAAQQKAAAAELQRASATKQQLLARRAAARADVTSAATFAGYDEIRSPVDGVVTAKFVDPGSQAAPGMILLTVEQTSALRIDAYVPESVANLHAGDAAEVETSGAIYPARITALVPSLDQATHTSLATLQMEDRQSCLSKDGTGKIACPPLQSGATARVRFIAGQRKALAIPDAAILTRGQLRAVYVVSNDNIAQFRIVTTGRTFHGATEILSGLDDGERIAAALPPTLRDGVQIAEGGKP